jgi:outer membrane protein assembly complex protein YaeT
MFAQSEDQREDPEVLDLNIRGVKAFETDEIEESIATDESKCRGLVLTPICWISKSPAVYEHNYLNRKELAQDILRIRVFYWKRGYRETTVDTVVTRRAGGVEVTFRVTEGPPTIVRKISVGPPNQVLSTRDIDRAMTVRAGRPLNLITLDSTRIRLSDKLWERGHADAIVRIDTVVVDDSARLADISIFVDPRWRATIGDIRVAGNEAVSERTIRNSLTIKEGELYRRQEIVESQRNLYESGLFRHAAIVVPPQGDSVKTIEVTVREAPLREARIGTGFNTIDFFQVEGRFRHYNLLGGARRLDLQGSLGNLLAAQLNNRFIFGNPLENTSEEERARFERLTWQASAGIDQPWFQNPRNTLSLSLFAHRRAVAPVFVDRGEGTQATFTREVAPRTPASATYRFEVTRVIAGDLYFCVYYGVCDDETLRAQRRRQRLSPVALTATVDRTNQLFSPTSGILGRAEIEHAAAYTASDYRYSRGAIDLASYFQIGSTGVLAVHGRAGIVKPQGGRQAAEVLHPRKRFYAGGSQSVRGYGENQLGPRALTVTPTKLSTLAGCDTSLATIASCDPNGFVVKDGNLTTLTLEARDFVPRPLGGNSVLEANVEYRFPIWRALGGAAFVDAALVGLSGSFRSIASGDGAVTPGAGIRYQSPVGPIRVDVGYNPSTAEDLPVYTEARVPGQLDPVLVELRTRRSYQPATKFVERLTFHFSIGQAF